MELSVEHAKAILSINHIKYWLPENLIMLRALASRNQDYHSLITNFLSNGAQASDPDIVTTFDCGNGTLIAVKVTEGRATILEL